MNKLWNSFFFCGFKFQVAILLYWHDRVYTLTHRTTRAYTEAINKIAIYNTSCVVYSGKIVKQLNLKNYAIWMIFVVFFCIVFYLYFIFPTNVFTFAFCAGAMSEWASVSDHTSTKPLSIHAEQFGSSQLLY